MRADESESVGEWLAKQGGGHVDTVVGRSLLQFQRVRARPLEAIARSFAAVSAAVGAYPEKIRPGLLEMSQHGWYLDHEMRASLPVRFKAAMDSADPSGAERSMVDHFQRRADGILSELIARHPHRQEILRAAFTAHAAEQYLLSVPVILTQVDGLCLDAAGGYLFMPRKRQPILDHLSSLDNSPLAEAFSAPLRSQMPVTASEKDRPADFSGMNRHQILHGEVVDYGSKGNSLRAISLLGYVSERLSRAKGGTDDDRTDDDDAIQ